MKTDKDGKDMRGVTVNRFAEGKNICIKGQGDFLYKLYELYKNKYLRKYACDNSCKSFRVKKYKFMLLWKP